MKYKTVGVTLGHKLLIRKRETAFDKKRSISTGITEDFSDHTEMKSHEFAAFQKRMFRQRKKDRKRRRIILFITFIITLLLIIGFVIFWNTYDFDLLKSSEF
ncbi:MAG: hypothetical protein R2786_00010 [Flavobacteriaceae bacterium]